MAELPSRVIFGLDSECMIAAVDSEKGILMAYLANRRATILIAIRDWKERYPSVEIEDFQHLAGTLNPTDLATRSLCSAEDVCESSLWQDGPNILKKANI